MIRAKDNASQAVGGEFETRIPLQKCLELYDASLIQGVFLFASCNCPSVAKRSFLRFYGIFLDKRGGFC